MGTVFVVWTGMLWPAIIMLWYGRLAKDVFHVKQCGLLCKGFYAILFERDVCRSAKTGEAVNGTL